ncbi:hypothetical protein PSY31_23615, partial [Shigella flexneri]|nr:hypothetical protein [Shigella flexneri]
NAIEKLNESPSSDNNNNSNKSNDYVQTTVGSNSNPSSAPIDHLSLARGSETPPFYQPDNFHLVNNPATYFPGFSGEASSPPR